MKSLIHIEPLENFRLKCIFSDNKIKTADLNSYLRQGEAFKPLLNKENFNRVQNRSYFIEWPEYELDLSADTLWHIGIEEPALYSK
jgi:Protein of unknown function (DUF2442)